MKTKVDSRLSNEAKEIFKQATIHESMLCDEAKELLELAKTQSIRVPFMRYAEIGSQYWILQRYLTQNELAVDCLRRKKFNPFSNPFKMSDGLTRDQACDFFDMQLGKDSMLQKVILEESRNIFQCTCQHGKRCHVDSIVNFRNKIKEA